MLIRLYLLGNLPFFKIHVNHFMAQYNSPCPSVISKCMLWVKGHSLSFEIFPFSNQQPAAAAKLLQSCPTLCDPIDGSPPGSSIPGILQVRTQEWVAVAFSNACVHAKLLQSRSTLCDPLDSSPPGSSVHKILQARILERVAISFSQKTASSYITSS